MIREVPYNKQKPKHTISSSPLPMQATALLSSSPPLQRPIPPRQSPTYRDQASRSIAKMPKLPCRSQPAEHTSAQTISLVPVSCAGNRPAMCPLPKLAYGDTHT